MNVRLVPLLVLAWTATSPALAQMRSALGVIIEETHTWLSKRRGTPL